MKNSFNKKIIFTNTDKYSFFPPELASKSIPDWYKETEPYHEDFPRPNGTIKKCIPIFDMITSGYILYTQVDVAVSKGLDGNPFYSWPSREPLSFHPLIQAPLHPASNKAPYAKWNNYFGIKTPPGYSSLFIQPSHRESVFTIFPGIVDTDIYHAPVQFPFVLNDIKWEGLIPAGTPIAQVIPIKRNSWSHELGSDKEKKEISINFDKIKILFHNNYKNFFWQRKEYK
jgi:hypothetical protein